MKSFDQWKTALSTSHTDAETLRYYRACGFEAVELSVSPQGSQQIDWPAFRKHADEAGMEIWSYHLPFSGEVNIAAPEEDKRRWAVAHQCDLMKKAAAIGIRRFIIHPSAEPIADEVRASWMAAAKTSLKEMADCAGQLGVTVCVEDLPRTCLGHTADEMLELLSADDRLRVCFDVNHLLTIYGCDHREFVEKLGRFIVTTHMSDYDFLDEKHFFPGNGLIDWKEVVEMLEAAGYEGPFLYEGGFSPSHWNPAVPFGKYEEARERHLNIKNFRGTKA